MKTILRSFIIFACFGLLPASVFAQLSSSNYQVDIYSIGGEGGGYATSSSYAQDGSPGETYTYDDPSTDDGVTYGSRRRSTSTTASSPSSSGEPQSTPQAQEGDSPITGSLDTALPESAANNESSSGTVPPVSTQESPEDASSLNTEAAQQGGSGVALFWLGTASLIMLVLCMMLFKRLHRRI